ASTVLARVVVGFAAAASVASRQSDVVDVSSCRARRQSYTALRHNGAVKLSGLLGSLVEAGRGSYSTVDGPEHGRARSLPSGRYAAAQILFVNSVPQLPKDSSHYLRMTSLRELVTLNNIGAGASIVGLAMTVW